MTGLCKLNNKSMRSVRREHIYQGIFIDLALLGVISKEECEILIGGPMPKNLVLPNGKSSLVTEDNVTLNENVVVEPETEAEDTETETVETEEE